MDAELLCRFNEGITPQSLGHFARLMHCDLRQLAAEAKLDAARQARPRETLTWGRQYLEKHFAKPASVMHVWLGAQLDLFCRQRGLKVNLIGPRGSAKSTIATLCYVLRAAVEGWEPYILIVSDTKPQAQMHLENVKTELSDNRLLARDYPWSTGLGPIWRSALIELPNQVVIESISTGQRTRGRRRNQYRPTLIVCDDLQNDNHISSAELRDASRQWFQGTLLNAGTPHTNVVNLATALHREALALELHRSAGWTSALFPAIQSWPTNTALWDQWETIYCGADKSTAKLAAREFYDRHREAMDEGAVLLWPEVEDLYTLMQMRVESGRTAFEREKQGSPVNPQSCEWPDSYFGEHIWFDNWPSELSVRVIALDPSKGTGARRADYSAYVMVGVDHEGMIYVEADMARRPTPQMVADGAALCRRFPPDAFGVEANQFQELLCNELAAEFARQRVAHVLPSAIHNHVDKLVRIRRLGPYLSMRRLRFHAQSASTRLLVDQLRDFPSGAHDDGPDALEMALRLAEHVCEGHTTNDGLGDRLPIG
jgi:predicted phage terminase large subunit-like protein